MIKKLNELLKNNLIIGTIISAVFGWGITLLLQKFGDLYQMQIFSLLIFILLASVVITVLLGIKNKKYFIIFLIFLLNIFVTMIMGAWVNHWLYAETEKSVEKVSSYGWFFIKSLVLYCVIVAVIVFILWIIFVIIKSTMDSNFRANNRKILNLKPEDVTTIFQKAEIQAVLDKFNAKNWFDKYCLKKQKQRLYELLDKTDMKKLLPILTQLSRSYRTVHYTKSLIRIKMIYFSTAT